MVGRDGTVQQCYEGERKGLPSEKMKQALNEYKVLMRLLCAREDSQHVWQEAGPTWRWGEVPGSLLQYGEVVVKQATRLLGTRARIKE